MDCRVYHLSCVYLEWKTDYGKSKRNEMKRCVGREMKCNLYFYNGRRKTNEFKFTKNNGVNTNDKDK